MTLPFVVTKMMTAKKASLKMHFNEKMVCNAKVAKIAIFMVDPFFCGLVLVIGVPVKSIICNCGGSYLKEIMH